MFERLRHFVNQRPICFIAFMSGLRDFILGIGFISGIEHVVNTQLYIHFDALLPHIAGPVMGAVFIIVGLLVSVFSMYGKEKFTRPALKVQAIIWLFSTISYCLFAQYIFAVMLGLFFCLLAGYLSYQLD